jgi:hypothetical protein
MTAGSLIALLEQLRPNAPLLVEITKEDGDTLATYDIGFGQTESGEFTLRVHE